jgi:plastocyanin
MCNVHPWMTATLVIEEPKENVKVTIPKGAGVQQIGQVYYDPEAITIVAGTTVVWENKDSAVHTVSSGNLKDGPNGSFDSGMIAAGDSFKFTFNSPGKQEYFCMVHPWMIGSVDVE